MLTTYRRHSIVVALALLAGLTSVLVQPPARAATLPAIASLTAHTEWHVVSTTAPGRWPGMVYQEWWLRDAQGTTALLYLGAASAVQKMVHWTGELGYVGAGYQVLGHQVSSVPLGDGTAAPVSTVVVQHLMDREVLDYAVVSPDGITARATDDLLHVAWATLRGGGGPYYLVRVSLLQGSSSQSRRAATRLLSSALTALRAEARAGGH